MQSPDGLLYTPARGRPWAYPDSRLLDGQNFTLAGEYPAPKPGTEQWVEPFTNGRALSALVLH